VKRRGGYILVEAVVAMAVLSITAVSVQRAVQTAIVARGLAQDYTTAQFLLEGIAADRALEPRIVSGEVHSDTFPPPHERFSYSWGLEKVEIPLPQVSSKSTVVSAPLPSGIPTCLGKLHIEIAWTRGGEPFSVVAETLVSPERIWIAPRETPP
jgi:type II secretory pathway pseudopilin PulG